MNSYFEWDCSYSVFIDELDMQHNKLFQMINQFFESFNKTQDISDLRAIILNMKQYALIHFETEEKYMLKYNYPQKENHASIHNGFIIKIEEFETMFKNESPDLANEIGNYLKKWLVNHILIDDKEYANYYKNNKLL
jgi:hemerythrin